MSIDFSNLRSFELEDRLSRQIERSHNRFPKFSQLQMEWRDNRDRVDPIAREILARARKAQTAEGHEAGSYALAALHLQRPARTADALRERNRKVTALLDDAQGYGQRRLQPKDIEEAAPFEIKRVTDQDGRARVQLTARFHPDLPKKAKEMGGRWNPSEKAWRFEADKMQQVRSLAENIYGKFQTFRRKDIPSISPRAAKSRFEKEHVATGRSKRRSTSADQARRAKRVAPAAARTPEDLRLQQEWFKAPNQLDFEGVDTPEAMPEDKQLKERPMRDRSMTRDRSFKSRGRLQSRRL